MHSNVTIIFKWANKLIIIIAQRGGWSWKHHIIFYFVFIFLFLVFIGSTLQFPFNYLLFFCIFVLWVSQEYSRIIASWYQGPSILILAVNITFRNIPKKIFVSDPYILVQLYKTFFFNIFNFNIHNCLWKFCIF